MERIIRFHPAYDRRHVDPAKNYGIHGVEIAFFLKGDAGAVHFVIFSHWYLPHVQEEIDARDPDPRFPYLSHKPMPADLGYHSPEPRFEGQMLTDEKCDLIDKPCYYGGSVTNAGPVFNALLEKGDEGVWGELEAYYRAVFQGDAA